jgi:hypothetical protein
MKKILKTLSIASLLVFAVSCENDDFAVATATGGPELLTPENGSEYNLSPANLNSEVTTFVWNHADYDVQTEVNYVIQFALAGTEFASVAQIGPTAERFRAVTVSEMNAAALQLGAIPFTATNVDVRIKGYLGSNESMEMYSNLITLTITAFTLDLPTLAVPGNHQGWNPPTAPKLASSAFGETDYEGFVWLDGEYKFLAPDASGAFDWGNTDYGDDGSFSGILVEQDESNCQAGAGYYLVKANTTALTYSTVQTNWSIIGAATPGGWDAGTALTYNAETKLWEGTMALSAGEFKFRANDAWTINYGGDPAAMSQDGGNLSVDAGGTYLVKLNFTNPRLYTYELIAQ